MNPPGWARRPGRRPGAWGRRGCNKGAIPGQRVTTRIQSAGACVCITHTAPAQLKPDQRGGAHAQGGLAQMPGGGGDGLGGRGGGRGRGGGERALGAPCKSTEGHGRRQQRMKKMGRWAGVLAAGMLCNPVPLHARPRRSCELAPSSPAHHHETVASTCLRRAVTHVITLQIWGRARREGAGCSRGSCVPGRPHNGGPGCHGCCLE